MKTQKVIKISATRTTALGLTGLAALLAVTVSLPAAAQSRYKVADLGTPHGFADSYTWWPGGTVNNQGHVAGFANNTPDYYGFAGSVAFLWTGPGQIELLPGLPGATETAAFGLNDRDQVVGDSGAAIPFVNADGVFWDGGVAHDLGTLAGDAGSDANAINNPGVIVGDSYSADGIYKAVVWDRSLRIHPLLSPSESTWAFAAAINDPGQIGGQIGPDANGDWPAVVWQNENAFPTLLALPPGGGSAGVNSINNGGQIVGNTWPNSGDNWLPCVWQDGRLIFLQVYGSDAMGAAAQINNRGQIAGMSGQSWEDDTTAHALLWENGEMIDLQTQIPADSGWVLEQAASINDRGQITGLGWHNGYIHAYLLTPAE